MKCDYCDRQATATRKYPIGSDMNLCDHHLEIHAAIYLDENYFRYIGGDV